MSDNSFTFDDNRFTEEEHRGADEFNAKLLDVWGRVIPRLAAAMADGPVDQVALDDLTFMRTTYARMELMHRVQSSAEAIKTIEASGIVDPLELRRGLNAVKQIAEKYGVEPTALVQEFAEDYNKRLARAGLDPTAIQNRLGEFVKNRDIEGMKQLRMEVVGKLKTFESKHGKGD